MTFFRSRNGLGRLVSGRIFLITLGFLASAGSSAQSAVAPDPEPQAVGADAAASVRTDATSPSDGNTSADTTTESAEPDQSGTPGAGKGGRSKTNVRTQKLAIGGLTIPTKIKPVKAPKSKRVSAYHSMEQTAKSRQFYSAAWGVDKLRANYTSSGNLIRFTFRVVQPKLAKPLGDHEASPYMFARRAHAVLQVPTMEKIGQLRQLGTLEPQKEYWMVFSNKGNLVRPGDRVDVIIGKFHADGLLVE